MRNLLLLISILTLLFYHKVYSQEQENNPWQAIEFLIGNWEQNTESSTVTISYEWQMNKQFIKSQSKAHFHPKDGKESSHEDVGYFSYDAERRKIVFREFHSEGFVNTYVLDEELSNDTLVVLITEHTENAGGMRAKLTIDKNSDKKYEMILYLAGKEGEFKACQWTNAERTE